MSAPGGRPEPRIGDKEREAAVTALGEHYAAGRITKEEFDERSSVAWEARTASALAPLFADLPLPHGLSGGWYGYGAPTGVPPRGSVPPGYRPPPGYQAPMGYRPPAPPPRRPRSPLRWLPLFVFLAVLWKVGLPAFVVPWLVLGVMVWALVLWGGRGGHGCRRGSGHTSGSRRDGRGTWS